MVSATASVAFRDGISRSNLYAGRLASDFTNSEKGGKGFCCITKNWGLWAAFQDLNLILGQDWQRYPL